MWIIVVTLLASHLLTSTLTELHRGKIAPIEFVNPKDFWTGETCVFQFNIPYHYPHSPPKVLCRY